VEFKKIMSSDNIKALPKNIRSNQELIQEAIGLGCTKAKVILTKSISMANWMKLQCQYGCSYYGTLLTCPPCTPDTQEMSEVLAEYEKAIIINVSPETHVREIVVKLENILKKKGFNKAFALSAQPCDLCEPCTISTNCQFPEKARPTLQACGIDVNKTILNNGWGDLGQQLPCSPTHAIGMVLMD
jgi:predicted metal-binding protein